MKKVIAVLCAIVVLILGTAIGVAVSASHLSEKGLLSAGDVRPVSYTHLDVYKRQA